MPYGSDDPEIQMLLNDALLEGYMRPDALDPCMPVQVAWFDKDEYASEVLGHGIRHPNYGQAGLLRRLRTWKRVPVLGRFLPAGVIGYQLVRQQVRTLLRNGIPEVVGDDLTREERLLRGVEEKADIPLRGSEDNVWQSPHFIATSVVMLRAKLGRMEPTKANRHVAARAYAKLCQDHGIGLQVQEQNRRMTMESFFKDDTVDRMADRHAVAPFWMRLICGMENEAALDAYDA